MVSFVVPPQMTRRYFWKTDRRNNGVACCTGLRDTGLGYDRNNEALICPQPVKEVMLKVREAVTKGLLASCLVEEVYETVKRASVLKREH